MKKNYLILLLFSLPFMILAQSITSADLPNVGSAFTMGVDTAYTGVVPSQGPGQTWDFSSLQNKQLDSSILQQ